MKVIEESRIWRVARSRVTGVQLFPAPLHCQLQALIAADTHEHLDAIGAWSRVRVLAEKWRKWCTDFITMAWPRTWETEQSHRLRTRNHRTLGRVWSFYTTSYTTARRPAPFCFLQDPAPQTDQWFSGASGHLSTCQYAASSVFPGTAWLFLEFSGPSFRLLHSAGSQPTCLELSWPIRNSDSPSFPLSQTFVGGSRIG